jgi:hypothetical protein
MYFWDGQKWVTTLSHDGGSRWNGSAWIPVGAAPPPAYFQPPRTVRVATDWTTPMQYAVAGLYLLQGIWAVTLPFLMAGSISDYFNQVVQQQEQLNPTATPPPADLMSSITGLITFGLAIGAVIGVAIAAVAIIGALKRWTWAFYAVLALFALTTISLPFTLIGAVTTSAINAVRLPIGLTWASVGFGILEAALFVWMLVALIRRGPWAMTRAS